MKSMIFLLLLLLTSTTQADDVIVHDADSLRTSLRNLKPGTTLKIAAGDYPGGQHVVGVDSLTVEALDSKSPPHFKGGANAWHFSRCQNLTIRHLKISGQSGNGLNLDDADDSVPRSRISTKKASFAGDANKAFKG